MAPKTRSAAVRSRKFYTEAGDGCWEWRGWRDPLGYGHIGKGGAKAGHVLAHRAVYEDRVGPIPDGCVLMHACDNPSCVNPSHLIPGTQTENLADMRRKKRGGAPPRSLTAAQIAAIRADLDSAPMTSGKYGRPIRVRGSQLAIAEAHGVQLWQVRAVREGRY